MAEEILSVKKDVFAGVCAALHGPCFPKKHLIAQPAVFVEAAMRPNPETDFFVDSN
ncbi:MAG: hypothetical protein R3C28_00205 [Pirellulaceae bacterium]